MLCRTVDSVPAGRGAGASDLAKDLFGTVLDMGEEQASEADTPDQSRLIYASPSWISKLGAASRERYMAEARRAVAS